MDIQKIDLDSLDFSKEELDTMGEVLSLAQQIRGDDTLYQLVTKHVAKKVGRLNSIADLKKHRNEFSKKTVETAEAK